MKKVFSSVVLGSLLALSSMNVLAGLGNAEPAGKMKLCYEFDDGSQICVTLYTD